MASEMVFMDTTSSCDASHNSVTFLLTPCAAGAAPLGILITEGQSKDIYSEAFSLFKEKFPIAFNNKGHPTLFMTDHSLAEMDAIAEVWPESKHLLCIFHVLQAVWRWLWDGKNVIHHSDRIQLMKSFQEILYSSSINDMEATYAESLKFGETYPQWRKYMEYYYSFKELWCLCYRNFQVRENHTNNLSEASIRVFKDIVLSRLKAHNIISLIDFSCTILEKMYVGKFRQFSNFRSRKPFLFFKSCLKKCSYLTKDKITQLDKFIFCVPSEKNENSFYVVNTEIGSCTCAAGKFGKFCKHECAIYQHYQICSRKFSSCDSTRSNDPIKNCNW